MFDKHDLEIEGAVVSSQGRETISCREVLQLCRVCAWLVKRDRNYGRCFPLTPLGVSYQACDLQRQSADLHDLVIVDSVTQQWCEQIPSIL